MTSNNKKYNYALLAAGLLFLCLGIYRFYKHFFTETVYPTFRLVIAAGFIGFGSFYLYKFLNKKN